MKLIILTTMLLISTTLQNYDCLTSEVVTKLNNFIRAEKLKQGRENASYVNQNSLQMHYRERNRKLVRAHEVSYEDVCEDLNLAEVGITGTERKNFFRVCKGTSGKLFTERRAVPLSIEFIPKNDQIRERVILKCGDTNLLVVPKPR